MTKSDLIKKLFNQTDLNPKQSETVINTVFEEIAASLERGQRVELRGFGTFGLKQRRARDGRNPKTGEPVKVEPKRVMFFKPGKHLAERVDG
jgi:integration host factor subunit beta